MNNIIARNIVIHNEIEKIAKECIKNGIKMILLKGAALIELFPEYSFSRDMEDVDVLVEEKNLDKFKKILENLGYQDVKDDPNVMYNPQLGVKIDIATKLWYLSKKENMKVILRSKRINNFYILPEEEIVRHILYHIYFEHNYEDKKWTTDLNLLKEKLNKNFDYNKSLSSFVKNNLNNDIFYKGHIFKFFLLPFFEKINYVVEKFFPSKEFLIKRYNIKSKFLLPLYFFYRWVSIVFNSIVVFNKMLTFLFLKTFLKHN